MRQEIEVSQKEKEGLKQDNEALRQEVESLRSLTSPSNIGTGVSGAIALIACAALIIMVRKTKKTKVPEAITVSNAKVDC